MTLNEAVEARTRIREAVIAALPHMTVEQIAAWVDEVLGSVGDAS